MTKILNQYIEVFLDDANFGLLMRAAGLKWENMYRNERICSSFSPALARHGGMYPIETETTKTEPCIAANALAIHPFKDSKDLVEG